MFSTNLFNLGPCQAAGGPSMIVHVFMHDPAVRRGRFSGVGHETGINGHARPEYPPHQLFCNTVMTLRLETPCTYISASAKFMACYERPAASLQCAGVETSRAHLRHFKSDLAQAGQNSFDL